MDDLDIITLAEAGELLDRSPSTLRNQVKAGSLRARLIGKTWVTTRAEVERYRSESLGQVGRRWRRRSKVSPWAVVFRIDPDVPTHRHTDFKGMVAEAVDNATDPVAIISTLHVLGARERMVVEHVSTSNDEHVIQVHLREPDDGR